MTITEIARSDVEAEQPGAFEGEDRAALGTEEPGPARRPSGRAVAVTGGIVVVTFFAAAGAVIYGIGPLLQARDQRALMTKERAAINQAAIERYGLGGVHLPTQAPQAGDPVGILAIPLLHLNQVVVEGTQSSQTVSGPGHVPGTAGLGQPGNSAIVGRNAAFGGPFAKLDQLRPGDKILTASVEGQSVYVVRSVRTVVLAEPAATSGTGTASTSQFSGGSAGTSPTAGTVSPTVLYGPTVHDQLTLVTSSSIVPWNSSHALVVVARMVGKPFVPTPQGALSPSGYGNSGDSGAWSLLILTLIGLGLTAVGSIYIYRRSSTRSAYLLTTAPLLTFSVLAGLSLGRLLPGWT